MNALNEQRSALKLKKIKNPEDRQIITEYIRRIRIEADNFINSEHTVYIEKQNKSSGNNTIFETFLF